MLVGIDQEDAGWVPGRPPVPRNRTGWWFACPVGRAARCPSMDFPTGLYPMSPRLPLVTLEEAREAVRLLQHFADDSPEGRDADTWVVEVALRLPAEG